MHLPAGPSLFIEVFVWVVATIAVVYYAPSYARPVSVQWPVFSTDSSPSQGMDRLAIAYLHGAEILSLVALPVGVMLYVCAPEIVSVILGGQCNNSSLM